MKLQYMCNTGVKKMGCMHDLHLQKPRLSKVVMEKIFFLSNNGNDVVRIKT